MDPWYGATALQPRPRGWDALGLWFQFVACFLALGCVAIGGSVIGRLITGVDDGHGTAVEVIVRDALIGAVGVGITLLCWKARPALVRGADAARPLGVVGFAFLALVMPLLALIGLPIAWVVAGRHRDRPARPDVRLPDSYAPNARVGSLEVTGYLDGWRTHREPLPAGTPVQVVRVQDGWAEVIAPNGWHAWVDARMITPG